MCFFHFLLFTDNLTRRQMSITYENINTVAYNAASFHFSFLSLCVFRSFQHVRRIVSLPAESRHIRRFA